MEFPVLVLPEGTSPESGHIFHRWLLADLACRDHGVINVVREFTFEGSRYPFPAEPMSDLALSLGFVKDLCLRPGGLCGTFVVSPNRPLYAEFSNNLEGILFKKIKLAPAYIGMLDPRQEGVVSSIDRFIEMKYMGLEE